MIIRCLFGFFLSLFLLSNCGRNYDYGVFARSNRADIDLFLIPQKFHILENDWFLSRADSHFQKSKLINFLKNYGRTINDLQNDPNINYRESGEIVTLHVAKTSHSTFYEYDKRIPVIFYGPQWFKKGDYKKLINQQHIVPTLAKLLGIRNPNGVETKPLTEILNINSDKPEIIVTIVLDQGGQQLFNAHPEIPININKIKKESASFSNAEVGHLDAHTAVGHMAIGTGAYPTQSTVIGNTFYKLENGKLAGNEIYAIEDTSVNPGELATETLADVLDNETGELSEVISQCYALRASIGMAGHGAFKQKKVGYIGDKDLVYWLDKKTGNWITDLNYYSLPDSTIGENAYNNYLSAYPSGWKDNLGIEQEQLHKSWHLIVATPAEARWESEIFRKVIKKQIIDKGKGKDGHTDLAYMTIKAIDAAGHFFGWESIEAEETFKEADFQVGLVKEMLEKEYGDKFVLVITADHGASPLPEIAGGCRLSIGDFLKKANEILPKDETGQLVRYMTVGQVSLNHELMRKYNINEKEIIKNLLEIQVDDKPFFKDIVSKSQVIKEK